MPSIPIKPTSTCPTSEHQTTHPQEDVGATSTSADPLPLPDPSSDSSTKLDVSGEGGTVKLDHLGPMVVNQDGTMSRVANWDVMAEIEKRNTLRILGKRNRERLDALKAKEKDEEGK